MNTMYRIVIGLILLFPVGIIAQDNKGIQFDQSMSWDEVVKKATGENK